MSHRIHCVLVAAALASWSCQESRTAAEPTQPLETRPTPAPTVAPAETPSEAQPPEPEPAPTEPEAAATLSAKDQTFVTTAAHAGMREVGVSEIAKQRAKRADIKQLADRMIEDHQRASEEMRALLAERGLDRHLPSGPDAATKDLESELGKLDGKKLEKRYLDVMLDDHRKAVELFREQSKLGDDVALREWAGKTLPTLESHLEHVSLVKEGKEVPMEMNPPKVGVADRPTQRSRSAHAH